jgi:gp16 family phage-associated protein
MDKIIHHSNTPKFTATTTTEHAMSHPTPNQIKHNLRKQGQTLKAFAKANGFSYRTVSDVIRGVRVGNFGEGREVRIKLGLPVND